MIKIWQWMYFSTFHHCNLSHAWTLKEVNLSSHHLFNQTHVSAADTRSTSEGQTAAGNGGISRKCPVVFCHSAIKLEVWWEKVLRAELKSQAFTAFYYMWVVLSLAFPPPLNSLHLFFWTASAALSNVSLQSLSSSPSSRYLFFLLSAVALLLLFPPLSHLCCATFGPRAASTIIKLQQHIHESINNGSSGARWQVKPLWLRNSGWMWGDLICPT